MRKTATTTNRLWRRLPFWHRAAFAVLAVAFALVQLGGVQRRARRSAERDRRLERASGVADRGSPHVTRTDGTGLRARRIRRWAELERLWDPTYGTFTPIPYGRNLFCAGHIQLADGRTLIIGGHITATDGLADTTLFDPATRHVHRGPDMTVGRWYPIATQLPDGRVLTFAGDNIQVNQPGEPPPFEDSSVDSLPSIYNPTTNAWTDLETARRNSPLYPVMFVLSDGRVFNAGPDRVTRILNPATATWTTVGTSPIDGMSAVMYRPNKIMKSGSWADPGFRGVDTYAAHARTNVIDMSAPTPAWRETAPMNRARAYHNLTLLPDGTVLASGGGSTSDGVEIGNSVLPAEIWNPDTETWTEVDCAPERPPLPLDRAAAAGRPRADGGRRAVPERSVGGQPAQRRDLLAAVPLQGPAPTADAPTAAAYGSAFDVTTPNAASISKVSLIRLPSVTHAQRPEPALPVPQLHDGRREADGEPPPMPTSLRPATTCSS